MIVARIEHHVAGRLRLKVADGKRNPEILRWAAAAVAGVREVVSVDLRLLTGSLVVHYQPCSPAFARELEFAVRAHGLRILQSDSRSSARQRATQPSTEWRTVTGHLLLGAGVAGVLLPIVPGTPFLIAAAAVLGKDHPVIARGVKWVRYAGTAFRRLKSS